jgi:peptide/nickel transport system permease protein
MGGLTWGYLLKRLGMWVLTIWIGTTIIFMIPRSGARRSGRCHGRSRMSAQSGFVENSDEIIKVWRARFGLDEPLPVQYVKLSGQFPAF